MSHNLTVLKELANNKFPLLNWQVYDHPKIGLIVSVTDYKTEVSMKIRRNASLENILKAISELAKELKNDR